jgi:hypothetical protein
MDVSAPTTEPAQAGASTAPIAAPDDARPPLPTTIAVLAGTAVLIGLGMRFVTTSHLWLDEALSVNISRLPLSRLPNALRHDGSPPLYYLILHGWMSVFGDSDVAVRALSGVFAAASLPLAWLAGRRIGGRTTAAAVVLLGVSSPFAIRYATEARMYSLLGLLVLGGFLIVARLLERPSRAAAVALALVAGCLLLTHYWSIFLVAMTGVVLLVRLRHRRDRGTRLAVTALAASPLLLLPWISVFRFQMAHTGTPWAPRPSPTVMLWTIQEWAGVTSPVGPALYLVLVALLVLALLGAPNGRWGVELDLRTRPGVRDIAVVCFGALTLALVVGAVFGSAFVVRYTSVVFPLFLLVAGFGTRALADHNVRRGVLAVAVILGLVAAIPNLDDRRTEAGKVAQAIRANASPGSIIAYCPDQLGPAVSRLLPATYTQLTFPSGGAPQLVDWVDYAQRNRAARSAPFAQALVDRAGPNTIWLVWSLNYRTYGHKCQGLIANLGRLRPPVRRVVTLSNRYAERIGLIEFRPR